MNSRRMARVSLLMLVLLGAGAVMAAPAEKQQKAAAEAEPLSGQAGHGDVAAGLVVTRAATEGRVEDGLARFTTSLVVESHRDEQQSLLLLEGPIAVTEWSTGAPFLRKKPYIRYRHGDIELVVKGSATYRVQLSFVTSVHTEEKDRSVTVPLIRALVADTEVSLPGTDLEVEAKPKVATDTREEDGRTVVTLYGGAGAATLLWRPKPVQKVVEPVVFAEQTATVHLGTGIMRIESIVDYSILQGALDRLALRIPEGYSLLSLDGEHIGNWDVAPGEPGGTRLDISFLREIREGYRLSLSLEKVLGGGSQIVQVSTVEPLGVVREKGRIAISAAKEVSVEATQMEGISPLDVRELSSIAREPSGQVKLAFRYLRRPFRLGVRIGEVEARISAEVLTLVRAGMDSMRLATTINYDIRDAGVFGFKVGLEEGLRLVDIEGENINNWDFDEGKHILTVSLRSKAEGAYALNLESEAQQGAQTSRLPAVRALDVDRETGYIAVIPTTGVKVETAGLTDISQIEVKELPPPMADQGPALAYRYIRPGYEVSVNVSKIEPELDAEVHTIATLREHELDLRTEIHYSIRRAGIFQLRVRIPAEMRRTNVEGPDIDDTSWDEASGVLTVNLRGKVTDSYVLRIEGEKAVEDVEGVLEVPVLSTVGTRKERGYLAILARASVRVKPAEGEISGLDDISVDELPAEMSEKGGQVTLAFKYYSQPWALALAVERIEPRVTAEVFNLLSVGRNLVTVSSTVNYTILHAGEDAFSVMLPAQADAVDIDGEGIKHRERVAETNTWKVLLHAARQGSYRLYVSFEIPQAADQPLIPFSGIEVPGAEHQTGYIAVSSRPDVELSAGAADIENLTPIDRREIPDEYLQGVMLPVLLAYRYISFPYTLRIATLTHEAAEVTVAIVEAARLDTTLTGEGNAVTDLVCVLRNSGRQQYLSLSLPADAAIWHAFVDREPVTPVRDGDETKINIARAGGSGGAVRVRVRYSEKRPELGRIGSTRLTSPIQDIDVMRLGWTLSLPDGYDIVRSRGTLDRLFHSRFMEAGLQALEPDEEVQARLAEPRSMQVQKGAEQQAWQQVRNWEAQTRVQAGVGGRGAERASFYTGSKPGQRARFYFQGLILGAAEPAWAEVEYVKSSVGFPLHGALVVVVGLVCLGLWRWQRFPRIVRAGLIAALALVTLAMRILAEEAYADYLSTTTHVFAAVACALFAYIVLSWTVRSIRHLRAESA